MLPTPALSLYTASLIAWLGIAAGCGSPPPPSGEADAAAEGVTIVDCSGLTITAGFWNSHVHFIQCKWADAANIPAAELSAQIQTMLNELNRWEFLFMASPHGVPNGAGSAINPLAVF